MDQTTIEDYEARIEMLKRRIAQLESNVKPASDLWGQHKQMIKLAEDYRLYLAANWAINMSGKTFGEKKLPYPASVLELVKHIHDVAFNGMEGRDEPEFTMFSEIVGDAQEILSYYRPQTDIVGELKEYCEGRGVCDCRRILEIISKRTKEGGV